MTNVNKIQDYGLLAELAYMKLENFDGNISNNDELKEFINISKKDGKDLTDVQIEELTGISFDRKQDMINLLDKYEIIGFRSNSGTDEKDFQGMFIQEKGTEKYTGAFRGTDSFTDISNDILGVGIADYNFQYNEAKEFIVDMMNTKEIDKSNLTLTGHSLGGIEVQQLSMEFQIEGYAFNPFGSSGLLDDLILNNPDNIAFANENIYTISYNDFGTINGDPLSNFATNLMNTEHVGTKINLYGKELGLDAHSGANLNILIDEHIQNGFNLDDIKDYNQQLSNLFWEQMDNQNVDITATIKDGDTYDFTILKSDNDLTFMIEGTTDFNKIYDDFFAYSNKDLHLTNTTTDQTYTIEKGDTLSGLAQKFQVTIEELIASNAWLTEENRISDDLSYALIKIGEKLTLPDNSYFKATGDGHPPESPLFIRRHDPLALDMDKDGFIDIYSLNESNAYFDLTGDGIKEKVGWIKDNDSLLAYDKDEDGHIDGINEVFGNPTTSGFDELREVADSNFDSKIDRRDELYNRLQLWSDKNADGISQESELTSLKQEGVVSIDLNAIETNIEVNGSMINEASHYTDTNNNLELAADVHLVFDARNTTIDPSYAVVRLVDSNHDNVINRRDEQINFINKIIIHTKIRKVA